MKSSERAGPMANVWWRRISYRRTELRWFSAIALAVMCVAAATGARALLGLIGSTLAFATYFPAVLAATLFGGRVSGLLAIPLSIIAVWGVFIEPVYTFSAITQVQAANFLLFALSSLLVVVLALAHRHTVFDLEDQERSRDLIVHELEHRSKNMLAVMASLINQTVKNSDEADTLIARMRAATDNRDLLDSDGTNASNLRDVLALTVQEPYGRNRVTLSGPEVILNGWHARSLRIVFHELTTNAVKYGALSLPSGSIAIDWTMTGKQLAIVWQESGGPKVSAPTKFNFGSKLISITLKQMKASFEPEFAEKGYCYRITMTMS